MNVSGNICPVCKKNNELAALVCAHCGAVLENSFTDSEVEIKTTNMPVEVPENIRGWSIDETKVPEKGIAVYVKDASKPAYIDSKGEFVIGRRVDVTSEAPEGLLDLSTLGGYSQGLSRRHALIRRVENEYEIQDLGSANGTWLDDQRLTPNKNYPLASGSHLRLGSMRLFVLYRPFAKTK